MSVYFLNHGSGLLSLEVRGPVADTHIQQNCCQPLGPDPRAQQGLGASRTLIQAVGRPGHLVCAPRPSMPP